MQCPYCGNNINNDSKFCEFCGGSLISLPKSNSPKSKWYKKLIFIIFIILIIIIYLIFCFLFIITCIVIFNRINSTQNFNSPNSSFLYKLINNDRAPQICRPYINSDNWDKLLHKNCMVNDTIYCKDVSLVINDEFPAPKTQKELEIRCKEAEDEINSEIEADQEYYANLCKDKNHIKEMAKENNDADWWDDMCGTDWRN